jgi:hypothetical protein
MTTKGMPTRAATTTECDCARWSRSTACWNRSIALFSPCSVLLLANPTTTYELEPVSAADLARALQLDAKFQQLQLGLVDGVVAAVAERRRILRVLTTDRRDFAALRVGPRYKQVLALLP